MWASRSWRGRFARVPACSKCWLCHRTPHVVPRRPPPGRHHTRPVRTSACVEHSEPALLRSTPASCRYSGDRARPGLPTWSGRRAGPAVTAPRCPVRLAVPAASKLPGPQPPVPAGGQPPRPSSEPGPELSAGNLAPLGFPQLLYPCVWGGTPDADSGQALLRVRGVPGPLFWATCRF